MTGPLCSSGVDRNPDERRQPNASCPSSVRARISSMTTREKAHQLLDELPESELEPVVEFIASRVFMDEILARTELGHDAFGCRRSSGFRSTPLEQRGPVMGLAE